MHTFTAGGVNIGGTTMENCLATSAKSEQTLSCDSAIPLPDMYLTEMVHMFIKISVLEC